MGEIFLSKIPYLSKRGGAGFFMPATLQFLEENVSVIKVAQDFEQSVINLQILEVGDCDSRFVKNYFDCRSLSRYR